MREQILDEISQEARMDPRDPRIRPAKAVSALLGQFFEMGARPMVREMTFSLVELCSGYDEEFRAGLEARFRNTEVLDPLDPSWEEVVDRLQYVTGVIKFPQLRPRSELDAATVDAYLALIREELPLGGSTHVATAGLLIFSMGIQHTADAQIHFELASCTSAMKVLIPIQECGHWMLAILIRDTDGNIEVTISDSTVVLQSRPYTYASLLNWLAGMGLKSSPSFSNHNPQQNMFGNDSGLFVLLGSRLAATSRTMPSELEACSFMAAFRRRVFAELLAKHLDPDSNHYEEFRQREGDVELGISLPTPPTSSLEDDTFGCEGLELTSWSQSSPTYSFFDDGLIGGSMDFGVDVNHVGSPSMGAVQELEEISTYPSDLIHHARDPAKSFGQVMQAHKTAMMRSLIRDTQLTPIQVPQLPTPEGSYTTSEDGLFLRDDGLEDELLNDDNEEGNDQSQEADDSDNEPMMDDGDSCNGTLIVQSVDCDDESDNEFAYQDSTYEMPIVRSLQDNASDASDDEEQSDDDNDSITSKEHRVLNGAVKVPWTTSLAALQGPVTAQFRYLAGIKTFYPASDDLRQLASILALSRPDAGTTGAIKICLQHDMQPFALNLEHEMTTFEACPREGYLFLNRETSTRNVQDSLYSCAGQDSSKEYLEQLVSRFTECRGKVDYFTDIDVGEEEARSKFNLPPSKIANLPNDMLAQTRERYPGIHSPLATSSTAYGTPVSTRQEDFKLCAVNHLLHGAPTVWVITSPASKSMVESLIRELVGIGGDCGQFVTHESIFLPTDKLRAAGIEYSIILQQPGDIIFTFPGAYRQGFNMGKNFAEATNYAPEAIGHVEGYIPCTKKCSPMCPPIPAQGMLPRSGRKRLPASGPGDTGARKRQKSKQGKLFASTETLVSRLQEAVLFRRCAIANNASNANDMFNNSISTKDLWRMNQVDSAGILRTFERRIFRDLLAERVDNLKASGASREKIMDDLGAAGTADAVDHYLRRGHIWMDLRKIFQEELPGKECWVIFCVVAPNTTVLECMSAREKAAWLAEVQVNKQEVLTLLELAIPSFMFALGYTSRLPEQPFEDSIYNESREWETWFNQ